MEGGPANAGSRKRASDGKHAAAEGLHVLDIASFIAGPAAATVLAHFGADVVKVEPPDIGDTYRAFCQMPPNPKVEGVNYPWRLDNRNKRSIELQPTHLA